MPDEATTTTSEDAERGKEPREENIRGELERRRETQRKLENELKEMRDRLVEFEDRDKTELQRHQERAAKAETLVQQLSTKVTALEKGAWVRSAAAEFDFHDPEDAVVNLTDQLAGLEDQRERVVPSSAWRRTRRT
jgi:chromosome segregation ATPase